MINVLSQGVSRLLTSYYLGPQHTSKLRLWGYIRKFQHYARLTIPYHGRGWLTIDERDYLQGKILREGRYEPEVWQNLSRYATAKEVVWDIGANIGSFSVSALLDTRVREVHAFEPDPLHAEVLEYNLQLNSGHWRLHRAALSEQTEVRTLYHASFPHLGGSSLGSDFGHGAFQVECYSIDDFLSNHGVASPTLMKIDVEGWEMAVVCGARRLFAECPPKAVVFEADSDDRGDMKNIEVQRELERYEYSVSWIRRPEGAVYHRENYLAVHSNVGPSQPLCSGGTSA